MERRATKTLVFLAFLLILVTVVACQSEPTRVADEPSEVAWDDRSLFREGLISSEQAVLEEMSEATVYHMDINISNDLTHIEGQQEVHYTNTETEALEAIYFRLFPNTAGGSLVVSAVKVDGEEVEPGYEFADSALRVPLPSPLQPGQSTNIEMAFDVEVPTEVAGNHGLFGYRDNVLQLDEFYPVIPVYDDEGWNVETPPSNGDLTHYDASLYLVRVSVPDGITVVTSGIEVGRESAGGDQILTFAAGPARDFILAASEKYVEVSQEAGETTVRSYAFKDQEEAAQLALQYAVEALVNFEDRFGPYPYREFDIFSMPMTALGMEYPGAIGLSSRLYNPDEVVLGLPSQAILESTTAHEVAHQWFYGLIGNDQIDEPWLDESLTQYATGLYYVDAYGEDAAKGYQSSWEGTWDRIDQADIPIGRSSGSYAGDEYTPIIYGRGPLFVSALAKEMGQDTFDEFMRDYAQRYRWGISTGDEFRQLAETHCQCDLSGLFEEWVYDG